MRLAPASYPAPRLDPGQPTGLVLLGLGGPDGPDTIAPFLRNLFADPMVLPLPAWLSRPLGRLIVRRRLAETRAKYARLGHRSPQLEWTQRQTAALAAGMQARGLAVEPCVAMRYWHPLIREALATLRERRLPQLLIVPTYPQFSAATTGSGLAELERSLRDLDWDPPRHILREWPLLPGYIDCLAKNAAAVLDRWQAAGARAASTALVFTAHALPRRFVRQGDPYLQQTQATVRAAHGRLKDMIAVPDWLAELRAGGHSPLLTFQSRVGPVRWLGPATARVCLDLARGGVRQLLVVPVSFNCEHIETLDELDHELAATVRAAGVRDFARTPALNLDPGWLDALTRQLVRSAFAFADNFRSADEQS